MKAKSPAPPDDMRPEYNFDYSTACLEGRVPDGAQIKFEARQGGIGAY
jgi:hypothetical protein